jgi:hypothetical protein
MQFSAPFFHTTIMSTSDLEALGLDAEVATNLQAIIGSDQLGDDAITEKLTELFGGKNSGVTPADASFLNGNKVKVNAQKVGKFDGQWTQNKGLYFFSICGTTTTDSFIVSGSRPE